MEKKKDSLVNNVGVSINQPGQTTPDSASKKVGNRTYGIDGKDVDPKDQHSGTGENVSS